MMRILIGVLLASLVGGPAKAESDLALIARERLRSVMTTYDLPSVSAAVSMGGELVWTETLGVADRRTQRPATNDTAYPIASITKPITAAAILMLVEQGRIELDAPANKYLGESPLVAKVGNAEAATVRRLLQHLAGLPQHFHLLYEDASEAVGMDETIRQYGVIVTPPGEVRQYSNMGYGILGYIVERVTGLPYERFVAEEIFAPLGMVDSFVATAANLPPRAAVPHLRSGTAPPFADTDHHGAAAAYASPSDLVRFGQFLIDAAKGKSRMLSAAALMEMTAPSDDQPAAKEHFGLGLAIWDHHGREIWHQSGSMPGVAAQLLIAPEEEVVVAVMSNQSGAPDWTMLNDLLSVFAPQLDRKGEPPNALPQLVGKWMGHAELPSGQDLEMAFSFGANGVITGQLNGTTARVLRTRNLDAGFFEMTVASTTLSAVESGSRPLELRFKLKQRHDVLNGSVTVISAPRYDRGGSALSSWASLMRAAEE